MAIEVVDRLVDDESLTGGEAQVLNIIQDLACSKVHVFKLMQISHPFGKDVPISEKCNRAIM